LIAHDQHDKWLIDSGFPKHISSEKRKFLQPKDYEKGNASFGNDATVPNRGKEQLDQAR